MIDDHDFSLCIDLNMEWISKVQLEGMLAPAISRRKDVKAPAGSIKVPISVWKKNMCNCAMCMQNQSIFDLTF